MKPTLAALLGLALAVTVLPACRSASFDTAAGGDVLTVSRDHDSLLSALQIANDDFAASPDWMVVRERDGLAAKQTPPVAVLACADSRAAPEWVFEQRPGRLFVVRDAGNIADTHAIASLEYAVAKLDTRLIVVLGHSMCGAVGAAASGKDPGTDALRALVREIQPAVAAHSNHAEGDELVRLAIDENVRHSIRALSEHSDVLGMAVSDGRLRIVGGVHDLATGRVRFLE